MSGLAKIFALLLSLMLFGCGSFDEHSSDICFVGDSITDLWDLDYYFPQYSIHKYAVSGAVLQNVATWNPKECEGNPTVMLIGTNNLHYGLVNDTLTKEFFDEYLSLYISQVKSFKASKFYAISILPRNHKHKEKPSINFEIEKFNRLIKESLDSSKVDYKFIDVYDEFLESEGKIHFDYYTDGLHLSQEGYELLGYRVREAL